MNKSKLIDGLRKLKESIKEIEDGLAKEVKESEPMFPAIGDGNVYFIMDNAFELVKYTNNNDDYDKRFVTNANANAFTDKKQAQACADYLKDRFWFIRKAIEFADGYEFVDGEKNYYNYYDEDDKCWSVDYVTGHESNDAYLAQENADKFNEWLNKHKPNGWG